MASIAIVTQRLASAKISYAARRLDPDTVAALSIFSAPRPGDLVLAGVVDINRHTHLELPNGRVCSLFVGDEVVLAYGSRYAPDQYEAEVPLDLQECDLVAQGGLAGVVRSRHTSVARPTRVRPVGLLTDANGRVINVADLAVGAAPAVLHAPPTIGFVGTSMNAGKSTAMAATVRGLTRAGLQVGATKITGTASGNDPWRYLDAGAMDVLDFTDGGYASTYQVPVGALAETARQLHSHLAARGAEVIVLEIADGILQPETRSLLAHDTLRLIVDGYVFAAGDAAGALFGANWLRTAGHRLLACSGLLAAAPLALRELRELIDEPVLTPGDLADPDIAANLLAAVAAPRSEAVAAPQVG